MYRNARSGLTSYFNPRSPCGERPYTPDDISIQHHFNPRSPCGERLKPVRRRAPFVHFNPRSPCGERLVCMLSLYRCSKFQSTLPVWGATCCIPDLSAPILIFQSTLPVWGATWICVPDPRREGNFNPRSPCGERQECITLFVRHAKISIHAPRVGSDCGKP